MKKTTRSIIAMLLTIAIVLTCVPVSAVRSQAAGERKTVPSIRNVKVIDDNVTFFGWNPYVIYEVDGVRYDSRYMSQKFNAMAWNAMSDGDRRKVNKRYWQLSKRKEAFGDNYAIEMGLWSDEALGYTAVKEALDQKWEDRYAGDLKYIYGKQYYETVRDGVITFYPDSDAEYILYNYAEDPRAAYFMQRYLTVKDLMNWGKTYAYDQAVRSVLQTRALGVNAISKELITIIVSNFLTPTLTMAGPSKAIGASTDMVTKLYDLFDSKANLSGKIQEFFVGKTVSTDDAVKAIKVFDQLVTKRFEIAQNCYDEACRIRAELDEEAPSLRATLENPYPGDEAKREQCEKEREARGDKINNPSAEVDSKTT